MAVSTPTLLSQFLRTRRHVCSLLFALAFLSLFTWRGPRVTLGRLSFGRGSQDAKIERLQEKVYGLQWSDKPTCLWQRFHEERYGQLGNDNKTLYIAMNFFNNEYALPNFFQELPHVVRRIGTGRVFVSIYENGSEDKTPELLGMCEWFTYFLRSRAHI